VLSSATTNKLKSDNSVFSINEVNEYTQGRRQKIFQGRRVGATEKRPKISKKIPKKLHLPGGGQRKKD